VVHEVEAELEDAAEHQLSGKVHHLGHLGVKRPEDGAAHDEAQPADYKNNPAPTPIDRQVTVPGKV